MSNFCTKCGERLNPQEQCMCEVNQTTFVGKGNMENNSIPEVSLNIDVEKIKSYFIELGRLLLAGIVNPISTQKYLISNPQISSCASILVVSFLSTFILFCLIIQSSITSMFSFVFSIVSSFGSSYFDNAFQLSLKAAFITNLVVWGICFIIMMIINILLTKKILLNTNLALLTSFQFPLIISQLIATLLIFTFPQLAVPIIVVGILMTIIIVYEGIKVVYHLNKDHSLLVCSGFYLGSFILISIIYTIMLNTF